jgi:hypothetical protein
MDVNPSWQSTLVGLGFIGLVALMFWRATEHLDQFDVIWAGVGSIVGVVTGAIPGFFFARAGHQAAREASERAELYAAHIEPGSRKMVTDAVTRMRRR